MGVSNNQNQRTRTRIGVAILLTIAAIHAFRVGSYLSGNAYKYYYSFASDIMIPFAAYFSLWMNEIQFRFLRKWYIKVIICFCVMTFSEIMQYFGIYFFGSTFDWIDILMYALGSLTAAFLDKQILERLMPFLKYDTLDN
ncbi:hypothetical protein [Flagellimonas profundi]|uniref:VanZ-like domain-containing protein n=1 Tax=Flagellimonas profundi TaxID=2915620 RepID=A0ABS3FFN6_9FLAO|nr:hypothetical protein [Allomuricauda profundi]MBO0341969.1 hypothetical protein [Allomuricauda profundi]